ncbi:MULTISPECIES: YggT family protein [Thermodesulfovibrio]|uniref:YggT family protein n=1 Tax=Thermodesulfovibrio TaxID=28261 RepID=UPI002601A33F|nr:YggT family protein [Thermodesulfovibrio sp.]
MTTKIFLNYTLSFIMWLVIGRAILSLFTKDPNNPIYALFVKVTEPIYRIARKIFPRGTTIFIIITIVILRILIVKYL